MGVYITKEKIRLIPIWRDHKIVELTRRKNLMKLTKPRRAFNFYGIMGVIIVTTIMFLIIKHQLLSEPRDMVIILLLLTIYVDTVELNIFKEKC